MAEIYKPNSDLALNTKVEVRDVATNQTTAVDAHIRTGFFYKLGRAFRQDLISSDTKTIGDYLIDEVLVPSIKRTAVDIVCRIFDDPRGRGATRTSNGAQTSYSSYYRDRNVQQPPSNTNGLGWDTIGFHTAGRAAQTLNDMKNQLYEYGVVTVGQMFDFAELSNPNPQIHKYGWKDLGNPSIRPTYNGDYIIVGLPPPKPI